MKPLTKLFTAVFVFFYTFCSAQLQITDAGTAPYNTQNLISNVFLGNGVEILNIQLDGDSKSVGFFDGGLGNIGIERGIVLSTGHANSIDNENFGLDEDGQGTTGSIVSDADLDKLASANLKDIVKYTIQFVPTSDTLRFRYVFASEEYPEFVCNDFNDVFGFFISGPNPAGGNYIAKNIALVPDPSDPSGLTFTNVSVAINNVHSGVENCTPGFPEYYNTNPIGTKNLALNGYLDIFTAEAIVTPCEIYTIKLVIGDVEDDIFNSAVFLEAKSFGTGSLKVSTNTLSVDGSLAEGCVDGSLVLEFPEIVKEDFVIDFSLINAPNSATPSIDYSPFPNQLIIPKGSKSLSIPLQANNDGILEGDEVIKFAIQVDVCNRDTFEILIRDDELLKPILPSDTTICAGENLNIVSSLNPSFILPEPPIFNNNQQINLIPEVTPIFSDIVVSGLIPDYITPSLIESVCITGLEHRILNDLDIYLVSPGGQFLELSTNNGFKTNNISDVDRFENTCFTPFATEKISRGNSILGPIDPGNSTYTGDYLPEGVWSDLWETENPSNGTWRLLIIDDQVGITGILEGWSITFRSIYNLSYEWTASVGNVPCINCKDINVSPTVSTEYNLKLIDSYGCERSESIRVDVEPLVEKPTLTCGNATQNTLEFNWNNVPNALSYEIRINGSNWLNVGLDQSHLFDNLLNNFDYIVEIRSVGANCNSSANAVFCSTLLCEVPVVTIDYVDPVSCPGSEDGEILVSATGLFPPFEFTIGNVTNNDGIFNNLQQGENTLFVKDAQNCSINQSVFVPGPDTFAFELSIELLDVCNVNSLINAKVETTGGTAPYSYLWDNASTDQELMDITPGTYSLTVTDANLCTDIYNLNVPQLQNFEFDLSTKAPSCFEGNDGEVLFELIEGTDPIEILWSDGSTGIKASNLVAGDYQVSATDALGCQIVKSFTIDQRPDMIVAVLFTDETCGGQNDGTAIATIIGGVAPFTYHWDGGNPTDSLNSGLAPGFYSVSVQDANGCEKSIDFDIDEGSEIVYSVEKMDVLCHGTSQGRVHVSASHPSVNIDILWDDGNNSFERINLAAGTYCFNLSANGTCGIDSCILIQSPNVLELNEMIVNPLCNDGSDGSIKLEVSGGTGPFQYMWSGPVSNIPESEDIRNLIAGVYKVSVTDGNNCQIVKTLELADNSPINIDHIVSNVACYGDKTGSIAVNVNGGQGNFTFQWTGPESFSSDKNIVENLGAGEYELILKDEGGCTQDFGFLINQPSEPLDINISKADSVCFGSVNGKLTINPSGGTIPYQILWSNGITSKDNFGISPGQYQVSVTDSRGCQTVAQSTVYEKANITIELDRTSSTCFGTRDATAQITQVSYGAQKSDVNAFEYLWTSSPVQKGQIAINLEGGVTYSVIATDDQGCTGINTFNILSPDPVGAEAIEADNVSCFGGNDGKFIIIGTGGSGTYDYVWDAAADSQLGASALNLSKGNYAVTISDSNGCEGVKNFALEEPRPLHVDFRLIDVSCFGDSTGLAEAIVEGGVGPYNYLWTNGIKDKTISDVPSEQYNITITDSNGCILLDSTRVNEPLSPLLIDVDIENVICFDGRNGKIIIDAMGGSGFYQYALKGGEFSASKSKTNLEAGTYDIVVRDFKGCHDTLENIEIHEPNEIVVDLGNNLIIPFGSSTILDPKIYNAKGNLNYKWVSDNIELITCTTCLNPTFNGLRESSFELLITDENGCQANDNISIRLENFSPFFVPTAFTPNNDGENDHLLVFGVGIKNVIQFSIYDRWGELVFERQDFNVNDELNGWDGIFKGEQAQASLYYWFSEVEFVNGFVETFNGNTTLIR